MEHGWFSLGFASDFWRVHSWGGSNDLPILRGKDKGGREPRVRIGDSEGKMVRGVLQGVLHDGSGERHKEHEVKDKQSGEENKG